MREEYHQYSGLPRYSALDPNGRNSQYGMRNMLPAGRFPDLSTLGKQHRIRGTDTVPEYGNTVVGRISGIQKYIPDLP